jgi:hypothetical protein
MNSNLYLVFSQPPEGLTPAEYDRWYHDHIRENIATPGFVAGQRFSVRPVVPSRANPVGYSHLALYEYDGDITSLRTALDERREAGDIVLPDWFPQITFGTWDCIAIDERVVSGR